MQQRAGPAAYVKHGPRAHHQFQVEVEVSSSLPHGLNKSYSAASAGIEEQAIDHHRICVLQGGG